MITPRLRELLERDGVSYSSIPHTTAYDANRTAQAASISGHEFAKTVVVKADGKLCMAVLPATDRLDLDELRDAMGADTLTLANETDLRTAFPDCDLGAMPPFGELYGMDVFMSPRLREDTQIAFNAGSHDEALRMRFTDYERLARPNVMRMS